jgi:WD40 repeat protein
MAASPLSTVLEHAPSLALALLMSVASSGTADAPRVDRHGDPLPEGAAARLGTTRFRALCGHIHFSADGKTLVGVDAGWRVRVWDATSGKLLHTRRLGERVHKPYWVLRTACSADGKTLLILEGASLQMWDLPSGKRMDVRLPPGLRWINQAAVSDDRRFLLLADTRKQQFVADPHVGGIGIRTEIEEHLLLWDTTNGRKQHLAREEERHIALAVAPDGKHLASSSYGRGTCVYEKATGKLLWRVPKFNAEKLAFTPDGRQLIASPGGGQSEWHVWDAATGRPARSVAAPKIGYVWMFALSPDGTGILAPTGTDYVLWDLQSGEEVQRWSGAKQGGKVAFAPDGRSIVTCDTIFRRWDVASGKALYPDVSRLGHVAPVRRLFFTPDGKRLASVGEDNTLIVWDVAAARPLHALPIGAASGDERWDWSSDGGTTNRDGWTLTPDGATVFGVDTHLTVHRWSVAKGRQQPGYGLSAAQADPDLRLGAMHIQVSPDGETLTLAGWPRCPEYRFFRYTFSFWDAQTGRLRRWGGEPGQSYRGSQVILSPDGRFVLSDGRLYDTRTGAPRQLRPARGGAEAIGGSAVFSPDGRLLAAIGKGHVWDVASGRPIFDIPQADTYSSIPDERLAAFSPDGRRFAFVAPQHLIVCDLPSGDIIVKRPVPDELHGHVDWASGGVAFAPDGRTVATGCRDGTILLWDVPPPAARKRLTEREAATLWEDLARDGVRGWAAVWRLQEDAETSVPFLRKHLPPVPRPEVDFGALIGRLDSEQFEEREAASRRLRELGRAAEDPLRRALKEKPTTEQKKRIEALLAVLERSPELQPELRTLRVVAVLESINTPAARRVVGEWADGLPGAPLTDEAARARARLRWRTASEGR